MPDNDPRRVVALLFDALPDFVRALDAEFRLVRIDPVSGAVRRGGDVDIIVTNAAVGVPPALLHQLPNARLIVSIGTGTDAIDLALAERRGIKVVNTPLPNGDAVADLALALVLATWRNVVAADRFVRAGEWGRKAFPMGDNLRGRVCGIAGLGPIGTGVALRAEAFGMKIAYHSRAERTGTPWTFCATITDLARTADILVLALPATPATIGMVDAAVLDALGPLGILVNVSRGKIVDEPALEEALKAGRIRAAGLDVLADEPHVPISLIGCDNVVFTPHIGMATRENLAAIYALGLAAVRDGAALCA